MRTLWQGALLLVQLCCASTPLLPAQIPASSLDAQGQAGLAAGQKHLSTYQNGVASSQAAKAAAASQNNAAAPSALPAAQPPPPAGDPDVAPPAPAYPVPASTPPAGMAAGGQGGGTPPVYNAAKAQAQQQAAVAEQQLAGQAEKAAKVSQEASGKQSVQSALASEKATKTAQGQAKSPVVLDVAPAFNATAASISAVSAMNAAVTSDAQSAFQAHLSAKAAASKIQHEAQLSAGTVRRTDEAHAKAKVAATSADEAVALGEHNLKSARFKLSSLRHAAEFSAAQLQETKRYLQETNKELARERLKMDWNTGNLSSLESNLTAATKLKSNATAEKAKAAADLLQAKSKLDKSRSDRDTAEQLYLNSVSKGSDVSEPRKKALAAAKITYYSAQDAVEKAAAKTDDEADAYKKARATWDSLNQDVAANKKAKEAIQATIARFQARALAATSHLPAATAVSAAATHNYTLFKTKLQKDAEQVARAKTAADDSQEALGKTDVQKTVAATASAIVTPVAAAAATSVASSASAITNPGTTVADFVDLLGEE